MGLPQVRLLQEQDEGVYIWILRMRQGCGGAVRKVLCGRDPSPAVF